MFRRPFNQLHLSVTRLGGNCHGRGLHLKHQPPWRNTFQKSAVLFVGTAAMWASFALLTVTHNDTLEKQKKDPVRVVRTKNVHDALQFLGREYTNASEYGVAEIYEASLPSNSPSEDRSAIEKVNFSPTLGLLMFGVFDGHNGGRTAEKLSKELFPFLTLHLSDLYSRFAPSDAEDMRQPGEPPDPKVPSQDFYNTIKRAFIEFDNILVHESAQRALGLSEAEYSALNDYKQEASSEPGANQSIKPSRGEAFKLLAEAYAGSCAVVGFYNKPEKSLHVALTGDSRAVLGRRTLLQEPEQTGKGKGSDEAIKTTAFSVPPPRHVYQVHQLSFDQTPKNEKEAEYQKALHPDEPALLKNNRFLGWGPSRAFGDGVMKWSIAVQKRLRDECFGDRPRSQEDYKTPPYFTAEPEITTFEGVQQGDFVVVASDGLWDCLTNEEVVGLVGKWLEERVSLHSLPQTLKESNQEVVKAEPQNSMTYSPSELPVIFPDNYKDTTAYYPYWRTKKQFISIPQDRQNVAHHLIRNAIGGADQDLTDTLDWMEGSRRRRFKDDITIQVIFFD